MRAVVYERYGPPSALRVDDIAAPTPASGQVLVRVAATSVNLSDWETLRGSPMYARLGGWRSPARRTLGSDIAGWVEAVGQGVTRFRPGDQVYGDNLALKGGFAEYAVAAESALAHKPAELTFARASTIPQAGAIALRGTAGAAAGQRVLISGVGGGSGSFAVQLAKRLGAHVTGVDTADKLEFMRTLGADEVIDYREQDFTQPEFPYDLILDLVAHRSVFAYRRALAPGGRYRCVGGPVRALLRVMTVGWMVGRLTYRRMGVLAVRSGPAHFGALAELCIAGNVAIHIDRTFGLDEVPDALAYVGEGHALGKVVVMIDKATELVRLGSGARRRFWPEGAAGAARWPRPLTCGLAADETRVRSSGMSGCVCCVLAVPEGHHADHRREHQRHLQRKHNPRRDRSCPEWHKHHERE